MPDSVEKIFMIYEMTRGLCVYADSSIGGCSIGKKPQIKMIAIVDSEFGVSKDGRIPWGFPEDMEFFTEKTNGCIVIMGKNTFFSIPNGPLKNRTNYVLSRTLDSIDNVKVFPSLETAMESATREYGLRPCIWIIGGADLYNLSLKLSLIDQAFITQVHRKYGADTFIDESLMNSMQKKIIFESNKYSIYEYNRR